MDSWSSMVGNQTNDKSLNGKITEEDTDYIVWKTEN